jgi:hypothetical protein
MYLWCGIPREKWRNTSICTYYWLIDWLNTFIAHIPILSNAHGDVLACSQKPRCHILRWDWSVLPPLAVGASFYFPFWEFWCMLVSVWFHSLVTFTHRLQDLTIFASGNENLTPSIYLPFLRACEHGKVRVKVSFSLVWTLILVNYTGNWHVRHIYWTGSW